MSAFWASSKLVKAPITALALAGLMMSAMPGHAERRVNRVRVNDSGIVIEQAADSAGTDTDISTRSKSMIDIDTGGAGIVRVFADAEVPAGRRVVGDVVAVFGSVEVSGQVEGAVVAVMGSVILHEGAVVDGDVVCIGGALQQAEGVVVNGESVSLGFFPIPWGLPALPVMLGGILVGWLTTVFIGWLFTLLFPTRMVRVASTASRRTAASFFVGLISIPGFLLLLVLLFVTVIGIPLAIVLPIVYALLQYAGQIAATYLLGCKLTGRQVATGSGLMVPLLAGTLFVAAFFMVGAALFVVPGVARPAALFFCLLGGLLILGLTMIGTGAFLLSRLGATPREVSWGGASAPLGAPEPQPAPSATA